MRPIVARALAEPLKWIAINAGFEGAVMVQEVERAKGTMGLNALTGKIEDLVKAGVIDPTKVTRSALQNAASIAALLLTTEALIADKPEKSDGARRCRGDGSRRRHGDDVAPVTRSIEIATPAAGPRARLPSRSGPAVRARPGRLRARTGGSEYPEYTPAMRPEHPSDAAAPPAGSGSWPRPRQDIPRPPWAFRVEPAVDGLGPSEPARALTMGAVRGAFSAAGAPAGVPAAQPQAGPVAVPSPVPAPSSGATAAVLITLVPTEESGDASPAAVVLIRRAAHLRRNPGEIGFPGGAHRTG